MDWEPTSRRHAYVPSRDALAVRATRKWTESAMDSPGVTLVVKTPNQKIQDLHIACALEWTVKQLKGHISSVYPTKPVRFESLNRAALLVM